MPSLISPYSKTFTEEKGTLWFLRMPITLAEKPH